MERSVMVGSRDPARSSLVGELQELVKTTGAERAAVMWTDAGKVGPLWPYALVDAVSDSPERPVDEYVVERGITAASDTRLRTPRHRGVTTGSIFLVGDRDRDWYLVVERRAQKLKFGPELGPLVEGIFWGVIELLALDSTRPGELAPGEPAKRLAEVEEAEDDGRFDEALRGYGVVQELAVAYGDARSLILSTLHTGRTRRKMGDWDLAKAAYVTADELAETCEDIGLRARSLLGMANIHRIRGNLPLARETYESSLALAVEAEDFHCVGLCEHGLSYMELSTGDPELGVVRAWAAYSAYPAQDDRVRMLSLLGNGFMKLGHLPAARSAYEILAHLAESGEARVVARDALSHVAARAGDLLAFRLAVAQADSIERVELSVNSEAQLLFHRGDSLIRLGLLKEARDALRASEDFASRHRLGVLLHQTEQLFTSLDPEPSPDPLPVQPETKMVMEQLEAERRELVPA